MQELSDALFGEPTMETEPSDFDLAFSEYPDKVNPHVAATMNLPDDDPGNLSPVSTYLNTHGYSVRNRHFPGHHIYPLGLWSIHTIARSGDGYKIEGDLVRYADFEQMKEISAAYRAGMLEEMLSAVHAEGIKEGPVRIGKPPIDPKGNPIVAVNNGNYGPLPEECKWIEKHDEVFVQYMGTDENWPDGCWAIETGNPDPDYYDREQIIYIARENLGMPPSDPFKEFRPFTKGSSKQKDVDLLDAAFDAAPRKTQTALAKVGITALIDEATGYQEERPKDDLREVFRKAKPKSDFGVNNLEGWAGIILGKRQLQISDGEDPDPTDDWTLDTDTLDEAFK